MDDTEIYNVLASYKEAIDTILERIDEIDKMVEEYHGQYDDRFHKIEDTLNNEILGPAKEAFDKYDYDQRFGEFHEKYGNQLDNFNDKFKTISGDENYDFSKEAFDEYNKIEGDRPDEDSYVASLVKQAGETLDAIKKAMGADDSATVEVEKTSDKPAVVEIEDNKTQGKEEEAGHTSEDVEDEDELKIEDGVTTDPESLEKLTKKYEKMFGKK